MNRPRFSYEISSQLDARKKWSTRSPSRSAMGGLPSWRLKSHGLGLRHDRGQFPRLSEKGMRRCFWGHARPVEASSSVSGFAAPFSLGRTRALTELLVLEARGVGRAWDCLTWDCHVICVIGVRSKRAVRCKLRGRERKSRLIWAYLVLIIIWKAVGLLEVD